MYEKKQLLTAIQKYDFVLYELQLYLDTHPNCRNALHKWKHYLSLRQKAVDSYVKQFGPIRPDQTNDTAPWSWLEGPWPWEKEAN